MAPDWVRSSAGWWAAGLVTDEEFVASLNSILILSCSGHPPAMLIERSVFSLLNSGYANNNPESYLTGKVSPDL